MPIISAALLVAASLPSQASDRLTFDAAQGAFRVTAAQGAVWLQDVTARVEATQGTFRLSDPRYERKLGKQPADDPFGTLPWRTIEARDTQGTLDLQLLVRTDPEGRTVARLRCVNRSAGALTINALVIEGLRVGSWAGGSTLQFGTCSATPLQQGIGLGGTYATATNRPPLAGAFLSTDHYLGLVYVTPVEGGLRITATNPADGVTLPAGAERESEALWLSPGQHPSAELERWADLAGRWNHSKAWGRNFATWCSWYSGLIMSQCENGHLEEATLANLPILASKFLALGLECTRVVDDSASRGAGDWPLTTSSLPHGYPAMADAMKAAGFRPGFWFDNNRVQVETKTLADHPGWFVQAGGEPVAVASGSGYGTFAMLDPSVPAVIDRYRENARKFRDAGYRYCFTDFTGESIVPPSQSHDPTLTGVEVSRRAQVAVREGFGEGFYWLSQQTPAANLGLADAMRTGADSFGENKASYPQAVSKWFMNRRLILCDPDTWCPLQHSEQWDRDWGAWIALTGYPMTIGGDFRTLPPSRAAFIERLLPPLNSTARPRDLWERPVPVVLEQHLAAGGEEWRVIGLFNWRDIGVRVKLNLDRLWDESAFPEQGFPADAKALGRTDRRYLFYDFWPEAMLGEEGGVLALTVPANSGRVITCRLSLSRPQIISLGSHLGQGVEELLSSSWLVREKTLVAKTRGLRGLLDTTVRLHVPAGWKVKSVTAAGQALSHDAPQAEVCRFTVPDRNGPIDWRVTFDGPGAPPATRTRPVEPGNIAEVTLDPGATADLRSRLPELIRTYVPDWRLKRNTPKGFTVIHYARAGTLTGEPYDSQLGFGLVTGNTWFTYEAPKYGLSADSWFDNLKVRYRLDGLDPAKRYRVGVTLYDQDSSTRHVDVAVARASDDREFVLAQNVVEPSFLSNARPVVAWYDVPPEAIDPKGLIVEVRHVAGANAICAEVWLAVGTGEAPAPLDPVVVAAWKAGLGDYTRRLLGERLSRELPPGHALRAYVRALDDTLDVDYAPERGMGRLFGEPYTWGAPPPADKIRFDWEALEYRFDGLDAAATYRLGLMTYDDKDQRKLTIAIRRASDHREVVLAGNVPAPSALRNDPATVQWFGLPAGAVDPAGTIVVIYPAAGPNATMAELWIAERR